MSAVRTSLELDDVHGGHGQTSAVDQAADVAVQLNVVEVELAGGHLSGVLLAFVSERKDLLLSEFGVVVKAQLGVQGHD